MGNRRRKAAALNLRLNEFTRVTLKEWKLVSEISQPTVSYTVSIPSGTQNISAGGVTSIGAVGVTVLTAGAGGQLVCVRFQWGGLRAGTGRMADSV